MIGRIALSPLAAALVLGLSLAAPAAALAQSSSAGNGTVGTQDAAATKARASKAADAQHRRTASGNHRNAQQARKAAPEPVIADAGPEQMAAAQKVYTGASQCEFNQMISVEPSAQHAGYIDVRQGKHSWLMKPVMSATGALRLEDVRNEALMIQIGTKTMLLNQKTGQRLVDDCRHPRQLEMQPPTTAGMLR